MDPNIIIAVLAVAVLGLLYYVLTSPSTTTSAAKIKELNVKLEKAKAKIEELSKQLGGGVSLGGVKKEIQSVYDDAVKIGNELYVKLIALKNDSSPNDFKNILKTKNLYDTLNLDQEVLFDSMATLMLLENQWKGDKLTRYNMYIKSLRYVIKLLRDFYHKHLVSILRKEKHQICRGSVYHKSYKSMYDSAKKKSEQNINMLHLLAEASRMPVLSTIFSDNPSLKESMINILHNFNMSLYLKRTEFCTEVDDKAFIDKTYILYKQLLNTLIVSLFKYIEYDINTIYGTGTLPIY
jgi:hypothetical protein